MIMLKDLLNWPKILKQERYAGGHHEIMESLFTNSAILANCSTGDYQGSVGYIYLVYSGTEFAKIVIISDSYGSCSGCDAWEGATDEDVRHMCTELANNAHVFDTPDEAIKFLNEVKKDQAAYYDLYRMADELIKEMEETKTKISKSDFGMFGDR